MCSALPGSINTHQFPGGHEQCEEFFDEERVALGAGVERVKEISIDTLLHFQDSLQHGRNVTS